MNDSDYDSDIDDVVQPMNSTASRPTDANSNSGAFTDSIIARSARARHTPVGHAPVGTVDCVVCVDTAYHFEQRARFFADVITALRPGGRLALSDLVLPDGQYDDHTDAGSSGSGLSEKLLRIAAKGMSIPRENLTTASKYTEMLQNVGFINVSIVKVHTRVFEGFASFIDVRLATTNETNSLFAGFIDYIERKH